MKLIKRQSKKTFKTKEGKELHYVNYLIELDNGYRIPIKPVKDTDKPVLASICEYER